MLKSLYLISFLDIFSLAILLPVAPLHLLLVGGSRFQIGLLASIHALLQLLIGPLVGSWSDTKGRKTLLQRLGFFILISNALLLATTSLNIYIASRVLFGLTGHAFILVKAMISDNVSKEKQNEAFSKIGAIFAFSFVLGPLVGSSLHSLKDGFFYIAILLTSLSALNLALTVTLPDDKKQNSEQKKSTNTKSKKKTQKQVIKQASISEEIFQAFINLKNINWAVYWDVLTFKFLGDSNNSVFFSSFGVILMQDFGSSQLEMASVLSYFSFLMIIANLTSPKVKERFYADDKTGFKRNLHGFVVLTLLFTFLYVRASFWIYVAVILPLAIFRTILETTWTEMVVSRTTSADRGKIMGTYESMVHMAGLASPIITGYVGENYGYRTTFLLSAVPLFVGSIIGNLCLVNYTAKRDKRSKKD